MSLINEALKKAQRQRSEPDSSGDPTGADGARVQKRSTPMRAQTMIVVAAGALALVVCSVVATVYLVTRSPESTSRAGVASAPVQPVASAATSPTPVQVEPIIVPAPVDPAPRPLEDNKSSTVAAAPGTPIPSTTTNTSAAALPAPPTTLAAPAPVETAATSADPASNAATSATSSAGKSAAPPNPQIAAFVDAIRVTGIRSSGSESKVLMNDRVYRVNEIVERNLNVKLVKVESDALTFVDPNGATYTKTF